MYRVNCVGKTGFVCKKTLRMSRASGSTGRREHSSGQNVGKPVMTKVVSCVKQAPEKGAEIICRLKDGIQAIIAENIK